MIPDIQNYEDYDFVREMFRAQFAYLYRRLREEQWAGMDHALGCWTGACEYAAFKKHQGMK